jgi:hypothetical protein
MSDNTSVPSTSTIHPSSLLSSSSNDESLSLSQRVLRLEALPSLTKKHSRLRFTCLSVRSEYLAIGTSNGSVYVYDRQELSFIKIVSIAPPDSLSHIEFWYVQLLCLSSSRPLVSLVSLVSLSLSRLTSCPNPTFYPQQPVSSSHPSCLKYQRPSLRGRLPTE